MSKLIHGCEIADLSKSHFDEHFISWLKEIGITRVIKLKKRKKGLTSSGEKHQCHTNVHLLTSLFGGRHKHGFLIRGLKGDVHALIYHSAWLTPENKLVDVTQTENETSWFHSGERDWDYFFLFDYDYDVTVKVKCVAYKRYDFTEFGGGSFVENREVSSYDNINKVIHFKNYKELIGKQKTDDKFSRWDIMSSISNSHWIVYENKFSKKSILTKKTWNEICDDPKYQDLKMNYLFDDRTTPAKVKKNNAYRDKMTFKLGRVA